MAKQSGGRPHTSHTAEQILAFIRRKPDSFWSRLRETRPLALFHEAAERVPAYKDFLRRNKVQHQKIKTWKDFQFVPPVNKKNYLRAYPLEKLCWDGSLKRPMVFAATSGSTGHPFYFPRSHALEWEASLVHELFFSHNARSVEGPTLILVCFGMGVWIGGLITYKSFEILAERGNYPVSILTPGLNKTEIFHALKRLAPQYRQTIIAGYPPFLKDLVDEAPRHGVRLRDLSLRFLFATESFSEEFRNYIGRKAGVKNVCRNTLNIYGSADIGTMAFETPAAILARRLALKDTASFQQLFHQTEKTPTLAQYNPFFVTFEALEDGEILLSGNNVIPLVRYAIGDRGGVFSFDEAREHFRNFHIDFFKEAEKEKVRDAIYALPFVYVYERADFSTKLYGATIHTEHVRVALQDSSVEDFLTGKVTMLTKYDRKHNQHLEINIELKPFVKESAALKKKVQRVILRELLERNSEYRNNYSVMARRMIPQIILWPAGDPRYFKTGAKQKWVLKDA